MNIYAILKGVGNGSLSVATDGAKAIGKLASAVSQSYKKGYEEAQAAAPIQDLERGDPHGWRPAAVEHRLHTAPLWLRGAGRRLLLLCTCGGRRAHPASEAIAV